MWTLAMKMANLCVGYDSMEEIDVCSLDENIMKTDVSVEKRFTSSFSIEQLLK